MTSRCAFLISVALSCAVETAAAEDLTIVAKVAGLRGGVTAREYISGSKVRMSQGDYDTIFDTATGRIVQIDMKAKEYYETSRAEIEAHNQAVDALSKRPVPTPPAPATMEKGTAPSVVAGLTCDPVTFTAGGLKLEACLARDLEAPAHAEAERLAALRSSGGVAAVATLYAQLRVLRLLPLTELLGGKSGQMTMRSRREIVELKRGPVPAETFEPPAPFKRKDSPYKTLPKPVVPPKS